MALIDRKDWLSVYGGSRGTAQRAGARDGFGLSAIATFVTTSPVERALFPHRLQPLLSSHLSYRRIKCGHFKVLPHTRVPGACVFSLFKMEWPNPSLAVCDGNGNVEEYLCMCVFM